MQSGDFLGSRLLEEKKTTFYIPKFKLQNGLKQKTSNCWAFLRQTGLLVPNPPKNLQVFLQILNPVKIAEILAPELVGGQSEMVVSQFCHTFFMLMW